jgi:pimeloyl-ACP methyl ester carboxylesterase
MRHAPITPDGSRIHWTEAPGEGPARVYVHGLGASSAVYFAHITAHPALAGRRSLFVDLPGFGTATRPPASATPWKNTPTPWPWRWTPPG